MGIANQSAIIPPNLNTRPLLTDVQAFEPYGSAAFNRKLFGIQRPGVYNGMDVKPGTGLQVKLTSGAITGAAAVNISGLYLLTVHQRLDTAVAVPAGRTSAICLVARYAPDQLTDQVHADSTIKAAEVVAVNVGAEPADSIILADVVVPSGATAITQSMISYDRRQAISPETFFDRMTPTEVKLKHGNWLRLSVDKGLLPGRDGTGSNSNGKLGDSNSWWQEVWANSYRGGSMDVTGSITSRDYIRVTSNDGMAKLILERGDQPGNVTAQFKSSDKTIHFGMTHDGHFAYGTSADITSNGAKLYSESHKPTPPEIGACDLKFGLGSDQAVTVANLDASPLTWNGGKNTYFRGISSTTGRPENQSGIGMMQRYQSGASSDAFVTYQAQNGETYTRKWAGSKWLAWEKLVRENDLPTIADLGLPLYTLNKTMQLTTEWMDTGIEGSHIPTGTYAVQATVSSGAGTGFYNESFSGVMSWYGSSTNSTSTSEIFLHAAGHADNGRSLFMRTVRAPSDSGGKLRLQIACSANWSAESSISFKFRKLI